MNERSLEQLESRCARRVARADQRCPSGPQLPAIAQHVQYNALNFFLKLSTQMRAGMGI